MKPRHLLTLSALSLLSLVPSAFGQTRMSQALIGATNDLNPLIILDIGDAAGPFVSASVDTSFTGNGANGQERTMTLQGYATAESTYGRMRTSVQGTLGNTFYNPDNEDYYTPQGPNPNGSPSDFGVLAFAGFTDTLQFGGAIQSGYKAQYVFFVDGDIAGSNVNTYLNFGIEGAGGEDFELTKNPGPVAQYLTTEKYAVSGQFAQTVDVLFTTQFLPSTRFVSDGSTISGSGNFSSTATLQAVLLFDQNDNPVTNFTVTGSSGTTYPTQAVPEPASMAALALGGLALLRRRRRG